MIFKIKTIEICNLRKEKDLDLISEEYTNHYNNSILQEKLYKKTVLSDFLICKEKTFIITIIYMSTKLKI